MPALLRRAVALCAAPVIALGVATLPSGVAASGSETDTAVLSFSGGVWTCTLQSSNGDSGRCTVVSEGIVIGCLVTVPLVRPSGVALTEPSGEGVSLGGTVVGTGTQGAFVGSGSDGGSAVTTAIATYSGACGHFGGLASATVSLSWRVA